MSNVTGAILFNMSEADFMARWPPMVAEIPWAHLYELKNLAFTPNDSHSTHASMPSVKTFFFFIFKSVRFLNLYFGLDQNRTY